MERLRAAIVPIMPLLIAGINHETADLNLRGQVAFVVDEIPAALQDARDNIEGLSEVVILSTCNRTEIIGNGDTLEKQPIINWLAENRKVPAADLHGPLYLYRDTEAIEHLAQVACGMDAMIFGETEILGQVKESFDIAQRHNCISLQLGRIFPHVFHVAKRVRTQTGIGAGSVSYASAILKLARQQFGSLNELEALLIGAGEMIELTSQRLKDQGLRHIVFANRTRAHAKSLAGSMGTCPVPLAEIPRFLSRADIVVSGTGSPQTIIDRKMMEEAARQRRHTMLMVDLAVPRDIDPAISEIEDIHLYCIDDLQDLVENGASRRRAEEEPAEKLIGKEIKNYQKRMRGRDADGLIVSYRDRTQELCRAEEERAQKRLRKGVAAETVLHDMAQSLTGKLVHDPSIGLRQASEEGRYDRLDWVQNLLGIPAGKNGEPPEKKMRGRDADGLIASYRDRAQELCRAEEKRAQKRLQKGVAAETVLHDMAQSLTGKLVHDPIVGLRQAGEESRHDLLNWAQHLLGIPAGKNGEPPEKKKP